MIIEPTKHYFTLGTPISNGKPESAKQVRGCSLHVYKRRWIDGIKCLQQSVSKDRKIEEFLEKNKNSQQGSFIEKFKIILLFFLIIIRDKQVKIIQLILFEEILF